jgi:hypothetical protein
LLSEVVLPSAEHHLLLVVRLRDADLVLDNLSDNIRLAAMTYDQYRWTRIQSPQNPRFWMRVQKPDVVHSAVLSNWAVTATRSSARHYFIALGSDLISDHF